MQLVRLEAERNQDSGGITPQRAPGRRRPRRLSGSGIPRLVEERHVGVVQELHFGTVADQGLGLFGQLIGYRHAFLISTAMAVPDVPIAWFYPLFMLAMPIAWLLYTATASYVHCGTR